MNVLSCNCRMAAGFWLFLATCFVIGCGATDTSSDVLPASSTKSLLVTNGAVHQLAKAAFPSDWTVSVVPGGGSSLPDRATIGKIQQATFVIWNGADFEPWRNVLSLPGRRQLVTTDGFVDRLLPAASGPAHQHGPQGARESGESLWAVWLNPDLAMEQLRAVTSVARRFGPQDTATDTAVRELESRLASLGQRMDSLTGENPSSVLLDDEQLKYLTQRLGWQNVAVAESSEAFSTATADLLLSSSPLAGTGKPSIVYIDLCIEASTDSYVQRMERNLDRLAAACKD